MPPIVLWIFAAPQTLPRVTTNLTSLTDGRHAAFFHRSRISVHRSLFPRLPPFRPNATIWYSMTPADAQPNNFNRPRLGIPWRTTDEEAKRITTKLQFYFGSVEEAGGEPVPISLQLPANQFAAQIADLDAFVLPGGPADVSPALYGAPHHKKTHEADANREKTRSEEHTSELQSRFDLVCRL